MKSYFVTGTGTGIGKTFSTGVLALAASGDGASVAVMKPVQTGLARPEDGDIGQIARMAPGTIQLDSNLACPYCLKYESSPHLAAAKENVVIDFGLIRKAYDMIVEKYSPDFMLLEGAGGLMVPIDEERMMIDLITHMRLPVILVAPAGLGMINHVILSMNELSRREIPVAGICINGISLQPAEIEMDNIRMIEKLCKAPIITVISQSSEKRPFYSTPVKIW